MVLKIINAIPLKQRRIWSLCYMLVNFPLLENTSSIQDPDKEEASYLLIYLCNPVSN